MSDSAPVPDSADERPEALESLLVEALEQLEQGGAAAVERLLAAHPELALRVRKHLERLRRVGLAGDPGGASLGERP